MRTYRLFTLLLASVIVAACGGGGSGGGDNGQAVTPYDTALATGNPTNLQPADLGQLAQTSSEQATAIQTRQMLAAQDIYRGITNLQLDHTYNSMAIEVRSPIAMPFIVADNGAGMAALAQSGNGRALVYGKDVLGWMSGTSTEQQHRPLFNRAFSWVVTGKSDGLLPKTLKIATSGYSFNTVRSYLNQPSTSAQDGSVWTDANCAIADPANICWRDADLLVFGGGTPDSVGLKTLVRSYLDAGKPIIYMAPSWIPSDGGENVVAALGMTTNGYPGNWFAPASGFSVGSTRTLSQALASANQMDSLANGLLTKLAQLNIAQSEVPALMASIDRVFNALADAQSRGIDIFTNDDFAAYRSLVLWADVTRRTVTYGGALRNAANAAPFLRTYASDSFLAFNRAFTTVPPQGAGDYMPAAAAALPVSTNFETINVTIGQSGGKTLIGRGAVPGKPVTIQVANAAGATSLNVQTSYLRAYGHAESDTNYDRPRRPHSFTIPMSMTGDTTFVSPFGGPLVLNFGGATAGTVIQLRIKGTTKYAHFDFTQNPSQAEIAEGVSWLNRSDYGWQTNKLVGGEIQQTIGNAKDAIGTLTPQAYVQDHIKGILFDSNHFANGYNNMPMSAAAQALCNQLGWACSDPMHRPPGVQHFIGWIAQCGYLCSGNPSDGYPGIDTGWGWAHELGHNTVQRVMHIAPNGRGCVVECDNNILASATMLRRYAITGQADDKDTNHTGLYAKIVANRATGLTGEAKRQAMDDSLWGGDLGAGQHIMRAVHFQLAFLYAKSRNQLDANGKPTMYSTLEFFQLLTKADRLVRNLWDPANKGKYGMGRYADNKTISNEDLIYVLSSKIMGKDLRNHFAMYGIPLTQTALDSIADLALPIAPLDYFALQSGKHTQLNTGVWVNMDNSTPAYPF